LSGAHSAGWRPSSAPRSTLASLKGLSLVAQQSVGTAEGGAVLSGRPIRQDNEIWFASAVERGIDRASWASGALLTVASSQSH